MAETAATSVPTPEPSQSEAQKRQLEIENLKLDIDSKLHLQKFGVMLQLLPLVTVLVAVFGGVVSLWQYWSQQKQHQQELSDIAQREFMKPSARETIESLCRSFWGGCDHCFNRR